MLNKVRYLKVVARESAKSAVSGTLSNRCQLTSLPGLGGFSSGGLTAPKSLLKPILARNSEPEELTDLMMLLHRFINTAPIRRVFEA